MALLRAGLPVTVPGETVNRLCGSGLQAVLSAAHAVLAGEGDVFVAGGVESMSRAPYVMLKPEAAYARGTPAIADSVLGWRFPNPAFTPEWTIGLGETAEIVAEDHGVSRDAQDAFAAESQRRAGEAIRACRFADEIVPVLVPRGKGEPVRVDQDEHPRPSTTLEDLAKLRPVFKKNGTVTAGNSSGINDGAAALLLMSAERARALGHRPMARFVSGAVAGVEPQRMGIGPVPASRRALERAGWSADDLDLVELNEAFAAQALPCIEQLGFHPAKVNVNGGAIALGHPIGCSGARIAVSLLHEMRRRGAARSLATMCIGVGQGISATFEKVDA
jgi:acetyl-CoA C-acetyltransferase/3-oxo-5,6-didehydrosuberyl-CoA/3-oxoadipyl-CoA thiolase